MDKSDALKRSLNKSTVSSGGAQCELAGYEVSNPEAITKRVVMPKETMRFIDLSQRELSEEEIVAVLAWLKVHRPGVGVRLA